MSSIGPSQCSRAWHHPASFSVGDHPAGRLAVYSRGVLGWRPKEALRSVRWIGSLAGGLALVLAGCGPDAEAAGDTECETSACDPGASATTPEPEGTSSGGVETSQGSDETEAEPSSDEVPCDVAQALATNCGTCHGESPAFGAPMALSNVSDFRVPAVTDPATDVGSLVLDRIVDAERPMPPDRSLSASDQALIEGWIDSGLPPNDGPMCELDEPEDPPPVGPDELPCEPTAQFRAFADGQPDTGFNVPAVDDLYMCFVFESPFGELTQGTAWAPVIDDERVVHHWLLLKTDDESYVPGTAGPCPNDVTLETQMLMGWAPGTPNFIMPEEAGLELAKPNERLVLQIHYNNTAGHRDAADSSGVALCTTEEPRENKAATLWLGTTEIEVPPGETITTSGDCDTGVRASEPVKMLLSWPHMHETGASLKTELFRDGNTDNTEVLVDVPTWNFENQIYYPHTPAVEITPGDILRTTCTFTNDSDQTVNFGEGTNDEMCFDFSIVYPIDAFSFENPFGPPELGRYCIGLGGSGFP